MRPRGQGIVLTDNFGRPYRCVVDHRGDWHLDNWLNLMETFSLHVADEDSLQPNMQVQMLRFAALVEQSLPPEMCSYNMHLLVCHLHNQEAERGHASKDLELWVEGAVQRMKRVVKYRTTQ